MQRGDDLPETTQRLLAGATSTVLTAPRQHGLSSHRGAPNEDPQQYYYDYMTPPREGFLAWVSRTLIQLIKFLLLCIISAGSYGIFYKCMMPRLITTKELHFDYFYEEPVKQQQSRDNKISLFRNRQNRQWDNVEEIVAVPSFPTATIDLTARHNEWEAHVEEVLPHPKYSRLLQSYQEYYIEMALLLPETQSNKLAGMFGIEMELWADVKVATSRKSYRFPHQTNWIRQLSKLIAVGPLLLGAMEETRTVTGFVFRRFIESELHPLTHIVVRLLQPDHSKVEIVGGEISIGEELSMFQELLRTWFWACYFVGTGCFAMWYVFVQNVFVYYWKRLFDDGPPCELDLEDDLQFDSFEDIDFGAEGENEEFQDAVEVEDDLHSSGSAAASEEAVAPPRRRGSIVMEEGERESDWEDLSIPSETAHSNGRAPPFTSVQTVDSTATDQSNPHHRTATVVSNPPSQRSTSRVSLQPSDQHSRRNNTSPTAAAVFEQRRDRAARNRRPRGRMRDMTDDELRESLLGQVPESTLEHVRERLGTNDNQRQFFYFF